MPMVPACRSASFWVMSLADPIPLAIAPMMLESRIETPMATSHPKKQAPQLKPPNLSRASWSERVSTTLSSRRVSVTCVAPESRESDLSRRTSLS